MRQAISLRMSNEDLLELYDDRSNYIPDSGSGFFLNRINFSITESYIGKNKCLNYYFVWEKFIKFFADVDVVAYFAGLLFKNTWIQIT